MSDIHGMDAYCKEPATPGKLLNRGVSMRRPLDAGMFGATNEGSRPRTPRQGVNVVKIASPVVVDDKPALVGRESRREPRAASGPACAVRCPARDYRASTAGRSSRG